MDWNENPAAFLRALFTEAVAAADPAVCVPPFLPAPPVGRTLVIGAGKAAAAMAAAVEAHWPGELSGLVITRRDHAVPTARIEVVEAAHPVPDDAGLRAAARIMAMVAGLTPDDLVICLISGGGSALMPLPLPGVSLDDKQRLGRALLASGASIGGINCVRRHLSAIKGGRLAAACHPARVVTLAISDVPGDDPVDIASGPTIGDPSTCADALEVLARYGIDAPEAVRHVLETGQGETVKPGDPRLERSELHLVATPLMALHRAAERARKAGLSVHILGDAIEGEARDVAAVMAGMARFIARHDEPFQKPCLLLSGGETTVTVRASGGRGGRNVEFLLALALALDGEPGIHALAADTDGVDGMEEIAGAVIGPDTVRRIRERGLSPRAALDGNDGHTVFEALGDQVVTGPTYTNVNDFRAILIT